MQQILQNFLKLGLIWLCQAPYNTPTLPIKKPYSDEYQFVQYLMAISDIVQDIHPTVPSPYTLLTMVGHGDSKWFSVLDLKDAFFCIPTDEQAQLLFTFEWQDTETEAMLQYCHKDLRTPQLYLVKYQLRDIQLRLGVLLKQLDDILITSNTYEDSSMPSQF